MPEVMLALRGSPDDIDRLQLAGWLFDLKIDGTRCIAVVDHGEVTLTSRTGQDMTARYPEIREALKVAYPFGRLVLDAEVAVLDERGLPSWPLTHKRDAQQRRIDYWARALPATLMPFGLLEFGNEDLRKQPYLDRRRALDDQAGMWPDALRTTICSENGRQMWELIREHRLEGMIAKDPTAPYRARRSPAWVKIKRLSTVSCLVGGTDPGEGSRASTFGALHLYLLDPDNGLVPVGKVGSGFTDRELRQVMQALHQPPLIVEVEYLDVSPDGQLRQPVFQRVRTDLAVTDCTIEQLKEA